MNPMTPSLVIIAATQEEYIPLPTAYYPNGLVLTEWALTAEELSTLMNGGHIRLWVWTFNRPFQPVMFEVADAEGKALRRHNGPERRIQIERRRSADWNRPEDERRFVIRRRS